MSAVTTSQASPGPSWALPELGLGTYLLKGDVCKQAVLDALKLGYRYIDTASQYANEAEVAAAIHESGVDRGDIVLSTKVGPRQTKRGYAGVIEACHDSLRLLNTDYIDIVMLHWPGVANVVLDSPKHGVGRREAWRALQDMQRQGKVRHIAVSNFLERHMVDVVTVPIALIDHQETSNFDEAAAPSPSPSPSAIYPFLNQIELHPLCRQRAVVRFCRDHGVLVQQYAPVAQCHPRMTTHPSIVAAAQRIEALLEESHS
jgi:diketogulonate reductase-like aldo/keto reductase